MACRFHSIAAICACLSVPSTARNRGNPFRTEKRNQGRRRSRRTRDMNDMWDDLVPFCTTTTSPTDSVQQHQRRPCGARRRSPRNAYDAEVRRRREILDLKPKKKGEGEKKIQPLAEQKDGKKISPASDAPTSPQQTSPKCSSTLCFSALKTSLPDIASGGDRVVVAWVWSRHGVDVVGMSSMRSQRFWKRKG